MTDNEERTGRRGERRPQRGKRESRSERAPADRNAVPTLRYGVDNNFPTFKKKMSVAALEAYKDLGRLFDTNEYYEPPVVDESEYDLLEDPHGLNLSEYKDARKARNRRIDGMKNDRAGLFAYLLMHLSNESLDAVKLRDDWEAANEGKDPLELWLLIEATHRVGVTSRIPAVLKSESRRAYQAVAQSTYESIVRFKERFDDLLANYKDQRNPEMEEADIAMDFYRALDNSRYAAFKTNLVNGINSGAVVQPGSLNEMYTQAAAYLIPTKPQHAGTHKTAFATTADKSYRNEDRRGGVYSGGKGAGNRRGNNGDRAPYKAPGDEKEPKRSNNPHEGRDCWGCGERGHVLRNCPELETAEDNGPPAGSVHMTIGAVEYNSDGYDSDGPPPLTYGSESESDSDGYDSDGPSSLACDSECDSEPDSEGESEGEFEASRESSDEEDKGMKPRVQPHGCDKKTSGSTLEQVIGCVAYQTAPKTTQWYEVLLDNQANISVVHPRLLKNIRRSAKPVKVSGLSGGHAIDIELVGHLDGFFDVLAYHAGAANVLCMADVEDKYDITYDPGHSYTVHMEHEDMVFYRRNKIYVGDMREWETYRSEPRGQVMVTTIAQNEQKLTARELKRVTAARKFIKTAGYPTLKEAVHLVSDGNLLNCDVTANDIRMTFEVDTVSGITPAMAKGKTVKGHPPRLQTDDSIKSEVVKQQLYTDVMHVNDQKFLLSVAEPLHLTLCTPIDRESTHALGMALQEHLDTLREKGFNPIRVHCDPQSSLAALSGRFPGTEIDVQGAGDHLSVVDIKIRRVKELIRCVHADLPWPLPQHIVPDLAKYAVTRLNIRRTAAAVNDVAPRVAFTGRKIRVSRELGLAFGDYCEVPDPKVVGEGTKSRRATTDRTESCIALHPCSN